MVLGMATTKITITVDNAQLKEIRALVKTKQTASTSAFVKHAIGVALADSRGWDEMLEEALQRTGGPLTKEEHAWTEEILTAKPRKAGKDKKAA